MVSFRVLVTGSRTWGDIEAVKQALGFVDGDAPPGFPSNVHGFPVTLIHGAAAGADTIAAMVAKEWGWNVEEHPAAWGTHTRDGKMPCPDWHWELEKCKMAGHRRNQEMVDSRADVCFAFIQNNSGGATGCASKAEAAGIPVYYWRKNG